MRRLLVIVLLTAFLPVSLLGYGGFAVLGIHSHCRCLSSGKYGPEAQTHQQSCTHHHYEDLHKNLTALTEKTEASSAGNSRQQTGDPSEKSEDCVLCQFFGYAKLQTAYALPPSQVTHLSLQRLFFPEDFFVVFDYTLRPIPRGPPTSIS